MSLTTMEISKDQKNQILKAGLTYKGVFNRGYEIIFTENKTPMQLQIQQLQAKYETMVRVANRLRERVTALEEAKK